LQIIRPLQISFNNQVLEQNRKFYFIASATLGVNLLTGRELLDFNYLKDVFEGMGENTLPDLGMPKPNGEFLVSGSYFAPGNQPVQAGEVKIRLDKIEKTLYVFGPRKWKAGLPSIPEEIESMPLDYTKAFGGKGYDKNPNGTGFKDGLLPCIENPQHLVASKGDNPEPAGFCPLNPMLPQRMKFQGTYGSDYKHKYFPGYPEDHNWKFFLCAPENQWIKNYYKGDEYFAIYNMNPEIPLIQGVLPGLYARCFINQKKERQEIFSELPLNLDTIWFFPEKLIGLLIFRGLKEVEGDEAEEITHALCAYEDITRQRHPVVYYQTAFEKRKNSNDDLLKSLNTQDLIPEGHQCAMELLMDMSLRGDKKSEFAKNIDKKAETMHLMVDDKIKKALQQTEMDMERIDIPDQAHQFLSDGDGKLDLRKMISQKSDADLDEKKFIHKLEVILPGITSGDPKKFDMKNFSFNKIDEIFDAVNEFTGQKEKDAKKIATEEIKKANEQVREQIKSIDKQIEEAKRGIGSGYLDQVKTLEDSKKKVVESLKPFEGIDLDGNSKTKAPLPRINLKEIKARADQVNPQIMEAIQHLQSIKVLGIENEKSKEMETQIQEKIKTSTKQIEQGLQEAEKNFKDVYMMGAHFMDDGLSPHNHSLEEVKNRFLKAVSNGEDVSGQDWACIDLAGINLDGINLSGAFLEQVNFKGASLKGANFSEAILARANFEDADLTKANFKKANIGAVHALRADFSGADMKAAKLSKGDFTEADFTTANLEDIESLDMIIAYANFTQAYIPRMIFIEFNIQGAKFIGTDLNTSAFLKCRIQGSDFSESIMTKCSFVDTTLRNCNFENTDLSNACFISTEPEKSVTEKICFKGACLKQANFQNMKMQKADYSYSNIENAFFGGTDLTEADFTEAQGKNAQFRKANLTRAKLNHINLDQGSLAKANLADASFMGANLHAVDFLRSNISHTDFHRANLDATLIERWRPDNV